jgi:hypothetical protein
MDASPKTSVNSGFSGQNGLSQVEQFHPSAEGLMFQIFAAKPNKEIVC